MADLPPHQRAAGHGRLSAATGAPGADVPLGHHGRGAGSAPSECRAACAGPRPVPRPAPKGRRVMADPSPRRPARRGMTVRAPPSGHRVLTYPWPPRPGRRVSDRLSAVHTGATDHLTGPRPRPRAPGSHEPTPRRVNPSAARHDRPRATLRAPGADVTPGQHGRGAGSCTV